LVPKLVSFADKFCKINAREKVPKLVSFADKFCKINAREKLKNNIINNLSKTSIK